MVIKIFLRDETYLAAFNSPTSCNKNYPKEQKSFEFYNSSAQFNSAVFFQLEGLDHAQNQRDRAPRPIISAWRAEAVAY